MSLPPELRQLCRDEAIYPQASSWDPETGQPLGLLAQREAVYEEHLHWSTWSPAHVLDLGAGKGFSLSRWPRAQHTAVEVDPRMHPLLTALLPPGARLVPESAIRAPDLPVADLVLCLRVPHHLFFELYSHLWILQLALLCRGTAVIETCFDPAQHTIADLFARHLPHVNLVRSRDWLEQRFAERQFRILCDPFFTIEQEFPSTYQGYRTFLLRRRLPALEEVSPAAPHLALDPTIPGLAWRKVGYTEAAAMASLTALQLLGRHEVTQAMLTQGGRLVGTRQAHQLTGLSDHATCRTIYCCLAKHFLPLGYVPWDVVPVNVFGGAPVDLDVLHPMRVRYRDDPFQDALCRALIYEYGGKIV
jgi:hypothetical protein